MVNKGKIDELCFCLAFCVLDKRNSERLLMVQKMLDIR